MNFHATCRETAIQAGRWKMPRSAAEFERSGGRTGAEVRSVRQRFFACVGGFGSAFPL
jgi:hypothetical protein